MKTIGFIGSAHVAAANKAYRFHFPFLLDTFIGFKTILP